MVRLRPRGVAGLLLALSVCTAEADIYVVVNAANDIQLTHKDVLDLYTGRKRTFPSGEYAQPFDLPHNDPARAAFYRALTGMDLARVNGYWARLMFSGQMMPPRPLPSQASVIDVVKNNHGAIGYLQRAPEDKALRLAGVLKEEAP